MIILIRGVLILVASFIGAASCRAQTEVVPLSESERARLSQLQARLQPLLKFGPETVPLQWEGSALVARFHARDFVVYAEKSRGEYEMQTHIEQGPQQDGFLLRLELKPGKDVVWPIEDRGPYWQLWQDAVPLNVLKLDLAAPQMPPQVYESPEVPRGHWAYDALTQLSRDGIIEGLPSGNDTRYEYAVGVARLSERLGLNQGEDFPILSPIAPRNRVIIEILRREFAPELMRLGVKLSPHLSYHRDTPNVSPPHLRVEMRFNEGISYSVRYLIQRAISDWAVADTQQQLEITKDK